VFKKGKSVIINSPGESYHGQPGTIIDTDPRGAFPYQVRMSDGDYWFTAAEVSVPSRPDDENPFDLSLIHISEPTRPY